MAVYPCTVSNQPIVCLHHLFLRFSSSPTAAWLQSQSPIGLLLPVFLSLKATACRRLLPSALQSLPSPIACRLPPTAFCLPSISTCHLPPAAYLCLPTVSACVHFHLSFCSLKAVVYSSFKVSKSTLIVIYHHLLLLILLQPLNCLTCLRLPPAFACHLSLSATS